jgi:hypothetical protein
MDEPQGIAIVVVECKLLGEAKRSVLHWSDSSVANVMGLDAIYGLHGRNVAFDAVRMQCQFRCRRWNQSASPRQA